MIGASRDWVDRFSSKIDTNGPIPSCAPELGPCHIWTAALLNKGGYGRFGLSGREKLAHRVAYELHVGPIPVGLDLDHLCRTPPCVNPSHLEPVTRGENTRRGNAPTAVVFRTNICRRGHELTPENTLFKTGPGRPVLRQCRTCTNAGQRRYYRQRMALAPIPQSVAAVLIAVAEQAGSTRTTAPYLATRLISAIRVHAPNDGTYRNTIKKLAWRLDREHMASGGDPERAINEWAESTPSQSDVAETFRRIAGEAR